MLARARPLVTRPPAPSAASPGLDERVVMLVIALAVVAGPSPVSPSLGRGGFARLARLEWLAAPGGDRSRSRLRRPEQWSALPRDESRRAHALVADLVRALPLGAVPLHAVRAACPRGHDRLQTDWYS